MLLSEPCRELGGVLEGRRSFRGEKNIIMLIPFGGQVNTLKGGADREEARAEAVLGRSAVKRGLGKWGAEGCKSVTADACFLVFFT